MKKAILLTWASVYIVFHVFTVHADETGKPFMTVYSSKEIDGHTQFWAIAQDDRGAGGQLQPREQRVEGPVLHRAAGIAFDAVRADVGLDSLDITLLAMRKS